MRRDEKQMDDPLLGMNSSPIEDGEPRGIYVAARRGGEANPKMPFSSYASPQAVHDLKRKRERRLTRRCMDLAKEEEVLETKQREVAREMSRWEEARRCEVGRSQKQMADLEEFLLQMRSSMDSAIEKLQARNDSVKREIQFRERRLGVRRTRCSSVRAVKPMELELGLLESSVIATSSTARPEGMVSAWPESGANAILTEIRKLGESLSDHRHRRRQIRQICRGGHKG
jgi:hypothetical protein